MWDWTAGLIINLMLMQISLINIRPAAAQSSWNVTCQGDLSRLYGDLAYDDGTIYEAVFAEGAETTCKFPFVGTRYARVINWEGDMAACRISKVAGIGQIEYSLSVVARPPLTSGEPNSYTNITCLYIVPKSVVYQEVNGIILQTTSPPEVVTSKFNSTASLSLQVLVNNAAVNAVTLGDQISVKATLTPSQDVQAMMIRGCNAYDSEERNTVIPILGDDGCGTGGVIPANEGSVQLDAYHSQLSPFSAFKIVNSNTVFFECAVKLCVNPDDPACTQAACSSNRKKRQLPVSGNDRTIGATITVFGGDSLLKTESLVQQLTEQVVQEDIPPCPIQTPLFWILLALVIVLAILNFVAAFGVIYFKKVYQQRKAQQETFWKTNGFNTLSVNQALSTMRKSSSAFGLTTSEHY